MTNQQRHNIWLVIPAHNEAETIVDVIEQFSQYDLPIVVIDDGSSDQTKQLAESTAATVLTHPENSGKAAALMTGFNYVLQQGAIGIITVDADNQHDSSHLRELMRAIEKHPESIIIAARYFDRKNAPGLRYMANRIADFWIAWACGQQIWDSQSGYRFYPTSLIKKITINAEKSHSFVFESEILIAAANVGYSIFGIPTAYFFPEGLRKSHFRPAHDIWLITKMVAKFLLSKKLFLGGLWRSLRKKTFFITMLEKTEDHIR